jgi:hypothetical protein
MSLTPSPRTPTDDLREAKLRLSNDIENLLSTFTKLTDLSVRSVDIEEIQAYVDPNAPNFRRYIVSLDISL